MPARGPLSAGAGVTLVQSARRTTVLSRRRVPNRPAGPAASLQSKNSRRATPCWLAGNSANQPRFHRCKAQSQRGAAPTRPVPSRRGARPPPSLPLRPPEQSNLQPPSLGSARGTLGSAGLGLARSTPRPGDRPTPDLSQPRAEPTLVPNLLLCCTNSCPSLAGGSIPRRRSQRFRRRSRAEGRGGAGRARVGDAREGPRGAVRVDGAYRGVCVRACVGVCARVCACVCGRRLHHSLGSCATA